MDAIAPHDLPESLAAVDVPPGALSATQCRALDEQGYLILASAVRADELSRLRAAFDLACEEEGVTPQGTRHPKTLLGRDAGFRRLLAHPPLLAAVRHVLGRPFRAVAVAGRDPLPGFGQQGLHIDCVDPGPTAPYQAVTALVLIDPFEEENGATRLVPGSHRFRRPPPRAFADPARRHPDEVVVTAPPGSVLAFNGHLWHGGTRNRSGGHRRVLQCAFS